MIPKDSILIPLGDMPYYMGPDDTVYKCTGKVIIPDSSGRIRLRVKGGYIAYTINYLKLVTKEKTHGSR